MRIDVPGWLLLAGLVGCTHDPGVGSEDPRLHRSGEREAMVSRQLELRGVSDPLVLEAMRSVPRERFMPADVAHLAYADGAQPIGYEQTISQPYIVARMTESLRLRPGERVLEVGTGSGYQAAVLAEITPHVFSIEILEPLATRAQASLRALGYESVVCRISDGYQGWPEEAPFDAIIVTAAPDHLPPALIEQLAPGGRLCIPVGKQSAGQELLLVEKDAAGEVTERLLDLVRFVPMTGEAQDG